MRTDHVVACDAVKALVRTVFSEWDAATTAATAPREEIIRKQAMQIRELQERARDAVRVTVRRLNPVGFLTPFCIAGDGARVRRKERTRNGR